ncbi:hypothetical protein DBA20_22775 [Pandoraea capi]|nr:hypothetical protein [Pandoraea sp. LA3]MDN4585805.1 hypothetical protein [Pandoraea capi]
MAHELAYTPTRCRVTISLPVARANSWWQRFPTFALSPADVHDASIALKKTNAPTGEPVRRVADITQVAQEAASPV